MNEDEELRRLFAQLRASDEASAPPPSFAHASTTARATDGRAVTLRYRRLALAGAMVLAIVAVWRAVVPRSPGREPPADILTWRPPTDVLLRIPGREVLATGSPLNTSMIPIRLPKGD